MIPPTARTCPNEGFWSIFACFGSKADFLKKFLDRSALFFGQETHEHVQTIKNAVWNQKLSFFRKNAFEEKYVFLMFSSDFHISDPKLTF